MGIFFGRKGGQVYDAYANNTHHNWWRDPGLRMSVFIITMACVSVTPPPSRPRGWGCGVIA